MSSPISMFVIVILPRPPLVCNDATCHSPRESEWKTSESYIWEFAINLNKVVATFEKHIFISQTDLTRTGIISNSYNEMFEA
jgi:hypothetical protein